MKNNFQSKSVPRGTRTIWRYLSALFILFTFAIGNVWADGTALADLSFSGITAAPSAYTYSTTSTPSYQASQGPSGKKKSCMLVGNGGNGQTPTITASGPTVSEGKRWMAFCPAEDCNLVIECYGSTSKYFMLYDADHYTAKTNCTNTDTHLSIIQGTGAWATWEIEGLTAGTWYVLSANSSSTYVSSMTFTAASSTPVCPSGLTISSKDSKTAFTEGDKIELTAALEAGNGDISYQWYKGGTAEANKLTGKTAAKLEIASCATSDAGDYYCVASKTSCSDAVNASAFAITVAADTKCFNMPEITSKPADLASVVVSGGTLSDVSTAKSVAMNAAGLKLDGNSVYLKVSLTSASLVEGTKITVAWKGAGSGAGIAVVNENLENKVIDLTGISDAAGSISHTFTAAEAANYADEFIIHRNASGTGIYVNAITVEDCGPAIVKHTVTLNYNDGETPAGSLTVVDGNAAVKPADPTRGKYTFLGWFVGDTDDEYDWLTAVTGDITLKAHWQDPWTITFDADGGSAVADITVKHNTKAEKPADPTYAGHDFNGWYYGDPEVAFDWDANVTQNYALKAHWIAEVAKYDIEYYDGETKIGTEEQVRADQHPTAAGISTDKPLHSFDGWFLNSALTGDPVALNTVTPSEGLKLYGKWTKLFASSYDMEAYAASEGASKAGLEAALTAANYAFTNINGIDNEHTHNYTYDGMKYKTTDGDLSFNVLGGKVVEVKTGHLPTNDAVTMYINGVADATVFEGANEDVETHKTNYFYSAAEALYRLEVLASKGTCSVKKVTIRDPFTVSYNPHGADAIAPQDATPSVTLPTPENGTGSFTGWFDAETGGNKIGDAGATYIPTANITLHAQWETISTDARLASITLDPSTGVWEPAFNPEIVNYTYTMPYGTAAVPQITGATAVNADGSYSIVSQASAWNETAVIRGVAASSDTKAYNITMKIAPKDGTSIFKAELTSATSATYSGLYADAVNSEIKLADDGANGYKFSGTSNYIKMALDGGTFATGDLLTMTYSTNPQQGELAIYENTTKIVGTPFENHTLEFTSGAEGLTELFIRRTSDNNFNGWVSVVEVTRVMNPVLKSITFDGTKINVTGTSVAAMLPNGADLTDVTPEIFWNGAGTAVVTTHEGAWDWGANTYVLTDKDGDETSYTITLTEDVLKHTVSYYSYNGEDLLGTEQVEDGEHPTATGITAPSRLGFTFQGWAITVGGDVEDLNDIAISADDELYAVYAAIPCPTSGTVYKFEIKDGLASENLPIATDMDMSSYIDATGIGLLTYSATANNKATINSDGTIQLKDATAAYLKVELACALAAGDQIRAHVSNNPIRVQVGTTYDSSKDLILDKNAYDIVDITAAMEGLKVLYIARSTNGNANLADFEIYRRPALTGASLADLTMRQGQNKTPELTLEPSADAIVTSQAWEIVGDPENLTGANIDLATGAITTGTLDNPANNGIISVKVTLNGSIEATCTVTVVDAIMQADVTKSTIWNWQNAGATADIKLTDSSDPKKNENFVLANVAVNNNADFESDKLAVEGEYMVRDYNATNPYFQGQLIQFHSTVAGAVRVKFSNTGNNPARELYINGVGTGNTSDNGTPDWSDFIEVPAGDVSITAYLADKSGDASQKYIRVAVIEFLTLAHQRTTGYAAGDLGTVCLEDATVIEGATLYELQGLDEHGYLAFDEILSGELEAGKPYLFQVTNPSKISFYKLVGAAHSDDEIANKGMVGTFTGTTLSQGADDLCYFSGRHIWRVNDFTVAIPIPANRCYVNYDVLKSAGPASAPAAGRRRVVMGVNGKDEAQGFENLESGDQPMKIMIDGTLYILRGEKVFDATGRLVK